MGISDARFPCNLCQRVFSTKQALAVHSFRAHQHVQTTRGFIDTPYYCACLQLFGSRPRVLAHLEAGSSRCKAVAVGTLPQLSPAQMSELDQLDAIEAKRLVRAGHTRVRADIPAIRLQGPYTRMASDAGISHAYGLRGKKNS